MSIFPREWALEHCRSSLLEIFLLFRSAQTTLQQYQSHSLTITVQDAGFEAEAFRNSCGGQKELYSVHPREFQCAMVPNFISVLLGVDASEVSTPLGDGRANE